ncbi:hypothetical protein LSTR_LSTR003218 [Laodelphax striatellus]|uniref:Uncharacterized protein n=1 Tax=Laodelphax striatellus TaxID=195883 RepID=A0A482XTS4_LAOST|nr:hypothetical protein LSTR_LSTR003218 [Laodelphax striatellus]
MLATLHDRSAVGLPAAHESVLCDKLSVLYLVVPIVEIGLIFSEVSCSRGRAAVNSVWRALEKRFAIEQETRMTTNSEFIRFFFRFSSLRGMLCQQIAHLSQALYKLH